MTFREGRLVRVLVSMADTLVSDFDVIDLFYERGVRQSPGNGIPVTQGGLLELCADLTDALRQVASQSLSLTTSHVIRSTAAHKTLKAHRFPWSEAFDRILRNDRPLVQLPPDPHLRLASATFCLRPVPDFVFFSYRRSLSRKVILGAFGYQSGMR